MKPVTDEDRKQRGDGILKDMVKAGLWRPVFQQRLGGRERESWGQNLPSLGTYLSKGPRRGQMEQP